MTLADDLAALPDAYAMLNLFRLPGSQPADTGSRQRTTLDHRTLLNLAVLDLTDEREKPDTAPVRTAADLAADKLAGERRQGILPTLGLWVRLADAEMCDEGHRHDEPHPNPTVRTECDWLTGHLDWIGEQPWANEITDEIADMLRDCQSVAGDLDQVKDRLYCLNDRCGWPVEEVDGAYYRCTGCGRAWGRLELHRMAERKKPKPLGECARLANVGERTLRRYKAEGRLHVAARSGTTDLYDIDQVMQATMNLRYREARA